MTDNSMFSASPDIGYFLESLAGSPVIQSGTSLRVSSAAKREDNKTMMTVRTLLNVVLIALVPVAVFARDAEYCND